MSTSTLRIHPQYSFLTGSLVVGSILLFPDVPPWAFTSALIFFFWRLLIELLGWSPPSRWMTGGLSVMFLVATLYSFQSWIGKEVSACFIVILSSLKILELREESEKSFLTLLGLFLVSSKFLFSLDLIYVFLEVPLLFCCIYFLFPIQYLAENQKQKVIQTCKYIVLAIPLTAFLYIFFPRFTQRFIEVQGLQDQTGLSGFSDSVQPGQISQLVQSNELVFRAELRAKVISAENLYWRGQALNDSQFGKNQDLGWKRSPSEAIERALPVGSIDYRIILEPTGKRWLFFLDQTKNLQSDSVRIYKTKNNIYQSSENLTKRVSYYGEIDNTLKKSTAIEKKFIENQMSSTNYSPAIQTLIQKFKKTSRKEFADSLLHYFQSNSFFYTLNPGVSNTDLNLEKFLFQTKKGFCEHFASSSAHLFRAAGIPARVVVGYQGGLYNRNGNFWTIAQKDAHAWIEYLNEDMDWVTLDPTTVVAPLRLELGAQAFFSLSEEDLRLGNFDELKKKLSNDGWLDQASNWFENVNYKWNAMLLDYDLEKQKQWLESLNISLPILSVVALVLCLLLTLLFQFLTRSRLQKADYEILQSELNQQLKRHQLQRKVSEGPLSWKQRVLEAKLFKPQELHSIFDTYIRLAYGKISSPLSSKDRKILVKKVRDLSK